MTRLNRLSVLGYVLCLTLASSVLARSNVRGLPLALMLRITLPIAPNVSGSLLAVQAHERLHHLLSAVVA